jgi:hypothetical protein
VVNKQAGKTVTVGHINNGIFTRNKHQLIFPGNTEEIPKNITASMQVSMNRSNYNHNAEPYEQIFGYGADLCLTHINNSHDILPHHLLNRYDFAAGSTVFHYEYAYSVLSSTPRKTFGFSMIT